MTSDKLRKQAFLLILILALLALASAVFIIIRLAEASGREALTADIYLDGELLTSISLDRVTESYTFDVVNKAGGTNTIEVRPGEIGVISADCPDKICVKQGFVHNTLLPVTCLPNRLVIQLRKGEDIDPTPDIITH